MCVAVLRGATGLVRLGRIIDVDENGATGTGGVATNAATTANSNGVVKLLVGNNVVRAARNTVGDVHPANVLLHVEGLGVLGAELEQLLHVEELDAVANTLRSDDQSVSDLLDLAPNDTVVAGGQTSKVFELTLLGHFCEGGTIGLANGNELPASALVSPAPATGAFTNSITELGVGLEVVEVLRCVVSLSFSKNGLLSTYDVLALVCLVLVALDGLSLAVLALDDILVGTLLAETVPLLGVVVADGPLLCPGGLFGLHHELHDFTIGIFFGRESSTGCQRQKCRGSS